AWAHRHYPPQERQAILASTSICFDLSVFELFVPLAWGGAVILASDLNRLPTLPARDEVTLVNTVPSVLERLLQHSSLPPSVTTVNLAGERLSAVVARAVYGSGRVEKLYNLYGPTEFTTYSTCALVPRDTAGEPTIGRPIDNTRAYVLDTRLKPVPTGVIGELHLGGAGLARGYVARPELTARKFIADPFSTPSSSSQRLYRTGDLVRRLGNGELQFVGRVDRQLKVRGFRIEPEEIEVALRRHTRVRESFVMGRSSDDGLELIAYVVPRGALTVTELRRSLAATLPGHMLPTTFVFLEELPRHPNGKVDSQRLPAPEARRPELQAGFVEPRGALEKRMAQIWADVLGVERVGIHDNFFELGGTSLQSLEVASRANDAGMPLLPEHLFAFQTIAELSAAAPVKSIEARVEQLARHDVKRAS
ncbi:MAG TPA: non-ribosomal peptide synthetase, partial [Candidatus Sulfotelmatobacter sp.]|nr:non-ribosomal peptide synthetase [Candidatus Sulfotelmatobacter sp.]